MALPEEHRLPGGTMVSSPQPARTSNGHAWRVSFRIAAIERQLALYEEHHHRGLERLTPEPTKCHKQLPRRSLASHTAQFAALNVPVPVSGGTSTVPFSTDFTSVDSRLNSYVHPRP